MYKLSNLYALSYSAIYCCYDRGHKSLLFAVSLSFRTSRPIRTLSVWQHNRHAKKITLTAPHLFSYLPFTIYRGMKLRNCAHLMISEVTSHTCHLPAAFSSLSAADSRVFRFTFDDFKMTCCAGWLLFAIQVLRNGHQWETDLYAKKLRSSTCVMS